MYLCIVHVFCACGGVSHAVCVSAHCACVLCLVPSAGVGGVSCFFTLVSTHHGLSRCIWYLCGTCCILRNSRVRPWPHNLLWELNFGGALSLPEKRRQHCHIPSHQRQHRRGSLKGSGCSELTPGGTFDQQLLLLSFLSQNLSPLPKVNLLNQSPFLINLSSSKGAPALPGSLTGGCFLGYLMSISIS